MSRAVYSLFALSVLVAALALTAPALPAQQRALIRYVGSSTVGLFIREAEEVYKQARFEIDTAPESAGGERAILEGAADLAGIADRPKPETLRAGIAATLIGRDAISVIVNASNPTTGLSSSQLRAVFTGGAKNWRELGGPDLAIECFTVGLQSATRRIFRQEVLEGRDYQDCQEIRPDREIVAAVRASPGAIGHISFSFLNSERGVRAVAVDNEQPSVTNFEYPIARPLYLLRREGNPAVDAFVEWTQTRRGQRVVMRHFVGVRVVGSVGSARQQDKRGTLIVYTETYPFNDGGIFYYPHRSYRILSRYGDFIRRVMNHRGENDERPTPVRLAPGTYLIRPQTSRGGSPEFFVTVETGKTTELYVEDLLRRNR